MITYNKTFRKAVESYFSDKSTRKRTINLVEENMVIITDEKVAAKYSSYWETIKKKLGFPKQNWSFEHNENKRKLKKEFPSPYFWLFLVHITKTSMRLQKGLQRTKLFASNGWKMEEMSWYKNFLGFVNRFAQSFQLYTTQTFIS